MKILIFVFSFLLCVATGNIAQSAQTSDGALKKLEQVATDDSGVREDFLAFPQDVQEAMAQAAQSPVTLERLQQIQVRSSQEFRDKIAQLPRQTQEQVYTLSRYPHLLSKLEAAGSTQKKQLKKISENYPKEVREALIDLGRQHPSLLREIQVIHQKAQAEFDQILISLPLPTQTAYRRLLQVPEAIDLMNKNSNFTEALAAAQSQSPESLRALLEDWNQSYEQDRKETAQSFQEDLKNNPKTQKQLQEATQVYAKENNIEVYETQPQETSITQIYVNVAPYPYWFGYPYWAPYAYWRPYPYWYYTGFYFGVGYVPYFVGYPNYYYSSWYFGPGAYYYQYPYLSRYYWNQYYRGRYAYPYRYPGFRRAISTRARYYPEAAHYGKIYETRYLQQEGQPRQRSSEVFQAPTQLNQDERSRFSHPHSSDRVRDQNTISNTQRSPVSSGVRSPERIPQNNDGEAASKRGRETTVPGHPAGEETVRVRTPVSHTSVPGGASRSGISSSPASGVSHSGGMGTSGGFRGTGGNTGAGRSGAGRR